MYSLINFHPNYIDINKRGKKIDGSFNNRKLFDHAVVLAVLVSLAVPADDVTMNGLSRSVRTVGPLIHDMYAFVILILINSGVITAVFTMAKNSNRRARLQIGIASNLWTLYPFRSSTMVPSASLVFKIIKFLKRNMKIIQEKCLFYLDKIHTFAFLSTPRIS